MIQLNKSNIEAGQVWSVKQLITNNTCDEIFVQVISKIESQENEFVKVRPVSFEIDLKAQDDIIIIEELLFEKPFFIEYWNEQPMSVCLLKTLIGKVDILSTYDGVSFHLSQEQKKFRTAEINKTLFIRQSALEPILVRKNRLHIDKSNKVIDLSSKQFYAIAATILLVFTFGFLLWQPGKLRNEVILATYAKAPMQTYTLNYGDETTLGSECFFEHLDDIECKKALEALNDYRNDNYSKAIRELEKILQPKEKNTELLFYLSISYFFNGQTEQSIMYLKFLDGLKRDRYSNRTKFYLGLAYLKNGNNLKARRYLKEVTESKSVVSDDAEEVLKNMRWF